MEPPRKSEVINVINSLNLHKSVGHDKILSYVLNVASSNFAPAMCLFIDNAFRIETFPHSCKTAE